MFLFVCLLQIRRLYMKLEGITCSTHAGVTLVEGKTAKHKTATKKKEDDLSALVCTWKGAL